METASIDETDLAARELVAPVIVFGRDGRPLANTDIVVSQVSHTFAFGNIGFDFVDLANGTPAEGDERLAEQWLELFNTATLPFYWGRFEPVRGRPDTERMLATARWFAGRGVALKGHPLAWHSVAPPWLLELSVDQIETELRARIRREVTDFASLIESWDAINEVVIMPVFDKEENGLTQLARARGRIPTIRLAFEEARAANPRATLVLNDFDLSSAYEQLIEGVLESGVAVDALGLQTHMHQGYRGEDEILGIVERFARFGLPLHFTETSLVSGTVMPADIVDLNDYQPISWPSTPEGEERQADELARHYRSLLSHPAVEAITYWGITDRGAWLGAPVGLVRSDGSPKPAFETSRGLIKGRWWLSPQHVRTDDSGRFELRGFAGEYRVEHESATASVELMRSVPLSATLS